MRAIAIDRFGGPEVMTLRDDLPEPPVGPDTVLVRAYAAGVNPADYKIRSGGMLDRFPHHFPLILGWDVAGVVERAGPAVKGLAEGDAVIGYVRRDDVQWGTYAQLIPAPPRTLAPKPKTLSWTEAAALPLAGLTAYQALTEALTITHDERVLIHGAAGGVGSFAVQIAKQLRAFVIATASRANHGHLRELGADQVLDYHDGPLSEQLSDKVDVVLDLVGGDALDDAPKQVHPGGRIGSILNPQVVLGLGGRYVFARPDSAQLAALSTFVDRGDLRVPLGRVFPWEQAADAHRLLEQRHVRGKIVLEIPHG